MSLKVVKRLKGLFRSESSARGDVPIIYPYADYVVGVGPIHQSSVICT